MATTIDITGFTGNYPFSVTICDITMTYCYVVATGVAAVPITVNIPPSLIGVSSLVVKIIDAYSCEYLQLFTCVTPTPTPTVTPTVTPSMIVDCNCITFDNLYGVSDYNFSLTLCDGSILNSVIYSGTIVYYCGKLPSADPQVSITIGLPCVYNSCPAPTSPLTQTPTPTPSPSGNFLLQENGYYILQEDGYKIIIT